ncbi:AP-2 complex subunit sigma [Geranomyces variabilis]|uniref:AP-2 complex subunit sigma n=1 Tax=Geranomyces variabilis TaxID=109894 RepID=A0AAD5TER1_9FUNG|nr:AP-2 complex subunit sigma [Geranomyces variabilis]
MNLVRNAVVENAPTVVNEQKVKGKSFGKVIETRVKSNAWWTQNFATRDQVDPARRHLPAPDLAGPRGRRCRRRARCRDLFVEEPWRWLGFSADEKRERIEADIDDEKLVALADVTLDSGTAITVPSSETFGALSPTDAADLINRYRESDALGLVDLYDGGNDEVVAPPVPATDELPFRVPIVKSRADWTKIGEMLGESLWKKLTGYLQHKGRELEEVDEIVVMEHHAPVAYHFAAPGWDMAFAGKLRGGRISRMAKGPRGTKVPNQLTIRVGRTITGPAWVIADVIAQKKSVLITAPPAHGKTTFLRDIARLVPAQYPGKKVCVIDRSEELGGSSIHWSSALGERVHVVRLAELSPGEAINRAFRNTSPAVVMSDEIGTMAEAEGMVSAKASGDHAFCFAAKASGIEIISIAHGTLADVVDNAVMKKLAGNVDRVANYCTPCRHLMCLRCLKRIMLPLQLQADDRRICLVAKVDVTCLRSFGPRLQSPDNVDERMLEEHRVPLMYHFAKPIFDALGRATLPGSLHRVAAFKKRTGEPYFSNFRIGRIVTGPEWVLADVLAKNPKLPGFWSAGYRPAQEADDMILVSDGIENLDAAVLDAASRLAAAKHAGATVIATTHSPLVLIPDSQAMQLLAGNVCLGHQRRPVVLVQMVGWRVFRNFANVVDARFSKRSTMADDGILVRWKELYMLCFPMQDLENIAETWGKRHKFILVQNRQGKTRLSKWYMPFEDEEKQKLKADVHKLVAARDQKHQSNFVEFRNYKIVYRRYAGLFFCFCVDTNDNELAYLEAIHFFVEVLDSFFRNVCELDLVFNFYKVYYVSTAELPGLYEN